MIRRLFEALYGNAYLLLSRTALFWAGNFVVGRGVHGHVPPIALAWCRWVLATLIVLPFAWPHLKRDWPAIRANWPVSASPTRTCSIRAESSAVLATLPT